MIQEISLNIVILEWLTCPLHSFTLFFNRGNSETMPFASDILISSSYRRIAKAECHYIIGSTN